MEKHLDTSQQLNTVEEVKDDDGFESAAVELDRDFVAAKYLNNVEAFKRISTAAKTGNHSAQAYLAVCVFFGCHHFPKNVRLGTTYASKCIYWLQAEALKGNKYSQFQLSYFLFWGIEVEEIFEQQITRLFLSRKKEDPNFQSKNFAKICTQL